MVEPCRRERGDAARTGVLGPAHHSSDGDACAAVAAVRPNLSINSSGVSTRALLSQAQALPEAERITYLGNIRLHREIVAAWQTRNE